VLTEAFVRHPEPFPNGQPSPRPPPTPVWINPPKVPAVAEEVANPMSLKSDAAAVGAVRASRDAALEHQRPGTLSGSFRISDVRSPLSGLRENALLPHALHFRRLAADLLDVERGGHKVFGRRRRVGKSMTNDSIGQSPN
jgi:hypothetical protein